MDKILDKIYSIERASFKVFEWNENNETVVFTNGCFDILHYGHISYLYEAKELGHKLIVGINTDDSIKRLKGEDRPINELSSRMVVLSSLEFVDMVIPFGDDTPIKLIEELCIDILVKGGDYKPEDIVGYDIVKERGGDVRTLDFVDGYSVTNIVNKISK
jgi:rfaE bifunctional protein nucleotidyltransferase chain/domain